MGHRTSAFDTLPHVASMIVLCEWQQVVQSSLGIDLGNSVAKLGCSLQHHVVEAGLQTRMNVITLAKLLAESMDHRPAKRRRKIRRRLGCIRVVPDSHFVFTGGVKHSIEIVLARTAMIIQKLSDAESMKPACTPRLDRREK